MTESISKEAEEKTAQDKKQTTNIAVLGGGCFWCTEAVFEKIEGVMDVVSGYAGGKSVNPTQANRAYCRKGGGELCGELREQENDRHSECNQNNHHIKIIAH